jgi:hypothetical protein
VPGWLGHDSRCISPNFQSKPSPSDIMMSFHAQLHRPELDVNQRKAYQYDWAAGSCGWWV